MELGAEPVEMGIGKTTGIEMPSEQVREKREGALPFFLYI